MCIRWKNGQEEYESEAEDGEVEPGSPHPKKKTKKKTTVSKGAPSKAPAKQESTYKAGEFGQERKAWISNYRKDKGVSFREASDAWNLSDRRAELLASLSPAELKTRRFV